LKITNKTKVLILHLLSFRVFGYGRDPLSKTEESKRDNDI